MTSRQDDINLTDLTDPEFFATGDPAGGVERVVTSIVLAGIKRLPIRFTPTGAAAA
jgi:hypothetical protein